LGASRSGALWRLAVADVQRPSYSPLNPHSTPLGSAVAVLIELPFGYNRYIHNIFIIILSLNYNPLQIYLRYVADALDNASL